MEDCLKDYLKDCLEDCLDECLDCMEDCVKFLKKYTSLEQKNVIMLSWMKFAIVVDSIPPQTQTKYLTGRQL